MIRKEKIYTAKNPATPRHATPIASRIFFFFSFSKSTGISRISSSKMDGLLPFRDNEVANAIFLPPHFRSQLVYGFLTGQGNVN